MTYDPRTYYYMWHEAFRIAALYIFIDRDISAGAVTPLRVVWRGISATTELQTVTGGNAS
jgi:hypothetical protein